jgi:hypothetical protein
MAFGYCYVCGTRVSTDELRAGFAQRLPQGFRCKSCTQSAEGNPGSAKRQNPSADQSGRRPTESSTMMARVS